MWNSLNVQCLTIFKKILCLSGVSRMSCVGEIKSFSKSRRDIGEKPTSLGSEFPRRPKKPWILIRLHGITFGESPFRRMLLIHGLHFRKTLIPWKRGGMLNSSPDTKRSYAT